MRIIFIVSFFMTTVSAMAQEVPSMNTSWKDSAKFMIKQLKEGAMLVRLHSRSEAIGRLQSEGRNDDAHAIELIQKEENREIVKAFRSAFNFCNVYFFMADSTNSLLHGKRSGFFLNDSLEIDPSITLHENFFMIAEKGSPVLPHKNDPTQPTNSEEAERSYLNETIIILDRNLNQLKSPFPHYAQEPFPMSLAQTDWSAKVATLNAKLRAYYKKSL